MILVFDLDDTLYEEITYVQSAFRSVALYLGVKYKLNAPEIEKSLIQILEYKGRGEVFNEVLKSYGIYSKTEVKKCLAVYRNTKPEIKLNDDAVRCLERFAYLPKYLVTDGNKLVQSAKITALNLEKYFTKTIPTHNFGIRHAKPSTYIFHKILEWEKAQPYELLYIGDNPNKDFVNLKLDGFRTVRINTGMFKDLRLGSAYEADHDINSLDELNESLLNKVFN
jgi:putative hydrolase of the HAD superfamily